MREESEMQHLRRCVELAAEALAAGDPPFGPVLVAAGGDVLLEDRNRVLPIREAVPGAVMEGPTAGPAEQVRDLHRRFHGAA